MEFSVPFHQKPCQVETKKLLFLIGIITIAAFAVQIFSTPYQNTFFNIPAANSSKVGNFSPLHDSKIANLSLVHEVVVTKNEESEMEEQLKDETEVVVVDIKNEVAEMGKQMDNETEVVVVVNNKNEVTEMGDHAAAASPDERDGVFEEKFDSLAPVASPITSPSNAGAAEILDANFSASDSVVPVETDKSAVDEQVLGVDVKEEKPILIQSAPATWNSNSVETSDRVKKMSQKAIKSMLDEMVLPTDPLTKIRMKMPPNKVTSISEMNVLLLKNRAWLRSMRPRWSSKLDQEILAAKAQIESALIVKKDRELYAPVYRNVSVFKRSYELMEEILKLYVYKEGKKPIFHDPILEGIYASEGWFMKQIEGNEQFTVEDPREAHLFYIPFSSQSLRYTLYKANSHSKKNLIKYMSDYLNMITAKYPFWNRTGGADHFFTACHDWAPAITKRIMSACLRALCNSDVYEGFVLGKDVALPETFVLSKSDLLKDKGGKPPSERRTLAFFAGNMHGYLRPILLKYWENKDPEMKIYGKMSKTQKKEMNYIQHMKTSKFCISAKGYEGNSPRVVEAIFFECVPVIISDNFVPPFFEVLNWEAFAVFVAERDIPNLKEILASIPDEKYVEMHKRVKKVQKHFLWHSKPVKYDVFHMTLHSIWYNRVFQIKAR
ncbi:probable glycosyltransferase At3g07620 [Papaver somniferum]|nr:probable glycosyltransferase At3g07620 [Papaver somniferum]